MIYDIVIIGAGASGLAAAYRAASICSQLNILVLEKEKLPGRKLSAAGNGKCNLTNQQFDCSCYHSKDEQQLTEWITRHSYKEILTFFDQMGILLYESNGYYYPRSNQGKQVTRLLWEKCMYLGVQFAFEQKVCELHSLSSLYEVRVSDNHDTSIIYQTYNVIVATGGLAAPKLGGSDMGYQLLSGFSLTCQPTYPILSPIYVKDSVLKLAKGVRLDAVVTLKLENEDCIKEHGQVQFNEASLSGIVIMNLSCYYNSVIQRVKYPAASSGASNLQRPKGWGIGPSRQSPNACKQSLGSLLAEIKPELHLDVIPDISWNDLKNYFLTQKQCFPKQSVAQILEAILPDAFVMYILKRLQLSRELTAELLNEKQINRLTSTLKKLTFIPVYKEDYDKAQATGGGIALSEICLDTFQSIQYPGLYLTGELLDVNGKCGGYNLTFAILSGIEAANSIVKLSEYNE